MNICKEIAQRANRLKKRVDALKGVAGCWIINCEVAFKISHVVLNYSKYAYRFHKRKWSYLASFIWVVKGSSFHAIPLTTRIKCVMCVTLQYKSWVGRRKYLFYKLGATQFFY
jgi:hypothetical protein